MIKEGTVVSSSSYREPLTFKVGSFFGTQALKEAGTKRIAKVVAQGKVTAFKLTRKSVNELVGDLGSLIKKNVNMRLLPAIDIFKSLSDAEIEVLVDSATDTIYKPNDTVIKSGESKNAILHHKGRQGEAQDEGGEGRGGYGDRSVLWRGGLP